MTPQHVISQLLASDSKNKNIELLKKIILTSYLGRLQINGQSPDNSIAFSNYLFDHENVMFDFTRMSDAKKEQFKKWLLSNHQQDKQKAYFTSTAVNEYRGFTAEVRLGWWARLLRWLQGDFTSQWKISDIDLSLNYQLLGVEMNEGQQGIQIGFKQLLVPPSATKYKASDDPQTEPMGNTKRVFITDNLVDQLMKWNLKTVNFETICKSPHPLAIEVNNLDARHREMRNYRAIQKYIPSEAWYQKLWNWFKSWFKSDSVKLAPPKKVNNQLTLLYEDQTTTVYQRQNNEILIKEKRPNIENLVYCGGGAKIFAHVGVWKALNEVQITPKKFAGSSAGAIMALMCYLGLSAEKIAELFKHFRQENLVYFNIDSRGISEPDALKAALDYAVALRVKEITTQYNIPYPAGKITFATLEELRLRFPDCGLGNELIVTATNKRLRKTSYFSFHKTPNMEVSEAVKISASIPVVFRDTRLNGDDYNDGGVLNNFPTDAFHADDTTFLESEYGNNMKTLAVQFDTGSERVAVDRILDRVYRENFLLNWFYGFLSGVSDPASGWEQDRLKLRKYAAQSIIVEVGNTSTTGFSVEEKDQRRLINSGYHAAKSYLRARYAQKDGAAYKNKEIMHSTFASLEELLAYSCYKGNKAWFDIVLKLIKASSLGNKKLLVQQAEQLNSLYFTPLPEENAEETNLSTQTFFGNAVIKQHHEDNKDHMVFLALYPIFIKLSPQLLKNEKEHDLLLRARHTFSINSLFNCLRYFNSIKDETHIVFHIFHNLVKALEVNHKNQFMEKMQELYQDLDLLQNIVYKHEDLFKPEYYGRWDLDLRQGRRVLKTLDAKSPYITKLCNYLKRGWEPLQTLADGELHDDEEHDTELRNAMVL
ncbi:Dot/Icm T4SS effector VpdC [Legionella sp. km772]|uniref:Dot/Icm T4SS effector VpdC n=1 Tax=Legionella sp. km772 TaxID=2498111 RepID=UPI000F8DA93C|nr:Dot/Icm T4SS effector VpdC [Legionella sp. km772]RUR12181.1 phospholipase [Legionella sp. km772]